MTPSARPGQLAISVSNTAKDGARIGMQIGVINGSVYYQAAFRSRSYRRLGLLAGTGGVLLGTLIALLAGVKAHPNPGVVAAALAASGCWAAARSRAGVCQVRHWSPAAPAPVATADARLSHRTPRPAAPRHRYGGPRPPKARNGSPRRGRRPDIPRPRAAALAACRWRSRRLRTARPEPA